MSTLVASPLYDELVDLLADAADGDRLRAFRLSPERQQRLDELLEKNLAGAIAPDELAELDAFEQFEHVVRLLKARTLRKPPSEA